MKTLLKLKKYYFPSIILLSLFACNSTRDEKNKLKDTFEKYNYVNVSKEENLFYNQAAWYIKMERKVFGICTVDEDSLMSVYTMFSAKSPLIAVKLRLNNENYSSLFKLKNGKLNSKVYQFDDNDSLIATKNSLDLSENTINILKTDSSLYNPPLLKDVLKVIFQEQEKKLTGN